MAVPTPSSSGGNPSARWALLVGLLATVALPAAIAATHYLDGLELLHAAAAIPVAAVGGMAALALGRRARDRLERTLGRAGGEGAARAGRVLGVLGICLAVTATISVGSYAVLSAMGY